MPHIQASLSSDLFKKAKKAAIDKDQTLNQFVSEAVTEHLNKFDRDKEANEGTGQPNSNKN